MRFSTLAGTLLLPGLLLSATSSFSQTQLDFGFQPQEIYQPATMYTARQFADGSRVVAGTAIRTGGGLPVQRVVRYLPNGALDAVFNNNVAANNWSVNIIEEFPDGKILVSPSGGSMTISGQTRNGLARLNPDGTLDLTYQADVLVDGYLDGLFIQPDGKVVFSGSFTTLNGQPAHNIARLNADGTVDAAFMAAAAATGFDSEVYAIARQADGRIVAGGYFTTFNGQAHPSVVRLNANGTLDPTFAVAVAPSYSDVETISVQADGKVLLGGNGLLKNGLGLSLVRVLSTGAIDQTFSPDPSLYIYNYFNTAAVQAQPDGKVLVINPTEQFFGQSTSSLIRLNADGSLDQSFQHNYALYSNMMPISMQVVSNGQILIAGPADRYASSTAVPTGLALLNSDGSYNPGFAPVLQAGGVVNDFVRQPDGKIVIGGSFTEINGVAVSNLARLNADGTLDQAYSANSNALGGIVSKVVLQPDGKILAGGLFSFVSGAPHVGLVRLQTNGSAEPSFAPPLQSQYLGNDPWVQQLALQPSGAIVLAGDFVLNGSSGSNPVRLTAAGQPDASFQTPSASGLLVNSLLVQPDGRILVGGTYRSGSTSYVLRRLLVNGGLDPAFTMVPQTTAPSTQVFALKMLADGRIMMGGRFGQVGSVVTTGIARLQANGTPDATFVSGLGSAPTTTIVRDLVVQPNQRILFSGTSSAPVTGRLLPNGGVDFTYASSQGPSATVWKVDVQPDGKLLMGGSFTRVAGQPYFAFTRLTDPNVLSVGSRQLEARLQVYPNPVHDELTLQLEAAAQPRSITLLDLTGKVVREQRVSSAEQKLPVRGLTAGVYLLRVNYAAGPVTRRIVVE